MKWFLFVLLSSWDIRGGLCFWDEYTTTHVPDGWPDTPRQSFFAWEYIESQKVLFLFPSKFKGDYRTMRNRQLTALAGLSIGFVPITSAAILNRRTLLSSANPLEPYRTRMTELRIWTLGYAGLHTTPHRYRVWRFRRLLPKSLNPEHQVGPRGTYTTRHDVALILSQDQMFLGNEGQERWQYPNRVYLCYKKSTYHTDNMILAGLSTASYEMIYNNYRLVWYDVFLSQIRNCENYLPKYWGKHICMIQRRPNLLALSSGSLLLVNGWLYAVGAFEIRYNEDRVFVFTDLRYYIDWINIMANITPGAFYDYAYQEWGVKPGFASWFTFKDTKYFPTQYIQNDFWPLGK